MEFPEELVLFISAAFCAISDNISTAELVNLSSSDAVSIISTNIICSIKEGTIINFLNNEGLIVADNFRERFLLDASREFIEKISQIIYMFIKHKHPPGMIVAMEA
jgi:hypothetical protein